MRSVARCWYVGCTRGSALINRTRTLLVMLAVVVFALNSGVVPASLIHARTGGCEIFGRTPTSTTVMPNVTKTLGGPTGWDTPFIVQNVGANPTTVDINFAAVDPFKVDACLEGISIAPGRSFAVIPNNVAELSDDAIYAVTVFSYGSTVVALVNEQRGSGNESEAMAYSGVNQGSLKAYVPNAAFAFFGYDTPLIIQNLSRDTDPAQVHAVFVSFDGSQTLDESAQIVQFRSFVIDPVGFAGFVPGTQYSVTVTSNKPVAVVLNSTRLNGGPHVSSSYNGLAQGYNTLWAPYFSVNLPAPDGVSPIVVQNVGTTAAVPRVTAFMNVPGATAPQCILTICAYTFVGPLLGPGRSWVFDPRDVACSRGGNETVCLPDGTLGGAEIESGQLTGTGANAGAWSFDAAGQLAAVVLPTSDTTAMAYQARPAGTRAFLPNVTRRLGGADGWTTPIRLIGSGEVEMRWYRFSDGALVAVKQVGVGRYCCGETGSFHTQAITVDPRDVRELADDTQYSVVINGIGTARAPFAAAVTEFADGGDNAMAYEAFSDASAIVVPTPAPSPSPTLPPSPTPTATP